MVGDFTQLARIAQNNCERNNHVLIGLVKTATPHLLVVIAHRESRGWVESDYTTWVMNTTQDGYECLNLGHYAIPTLREAYADALDRERF